MASPHPKSWLLYQNLSPLNLLPVTPQQPGSWQINSILSQSTYTKKKKKKVWLFFWKPNSLLDPGLDLEILLIIVIVDHLFKNVSHRHIIYQKKDNFIPYSKLKTDFKNINLKKNDGEKNIMKMWPQPVKFAEVK